ncbi:uncharacterized protein LOC113470741 [Diaphorina citri]|uniref:Uncharacterized protein LOC113470741 n=1 Tax=Diaphorina citri TaxID=121845 RepID=A0A3Q0J9W8_DIACI|nr:uncharacterized protein LOC113470741 [Diaphorina citri]
MEKDSQILVQHPQSPAQSRNSPNQFDFDLQTPERDLSPDTNIDEDQIKPTIIPRRRHSEIINRFENLALDEPPDLTDLRKIKPTNLTCGGTDSSPRHRRASLNDAPNQQRFSVNINNINSSRVTDDNTSKTLHVNSARANDTDASTQRRFTVNSSRATDSDASTQRLFASSDEDQIKPTIIPRRRHSEIINRFENLALDEPPDLTDLRKIKPTKLTYGGSSDTSSSPRHRRASLNDVPNQRRLNLNVNNVNSSRVTDDNASTVRRFSVNNISSSRLIDADALTPRHFSVNSARANDADASTQRRFTVNSSRATDSDASTQRLFASSRLDADLGRDITNFINDNTARIEDKVELIDQLRKGFFNVDCLRRIRSERHQYSGSAFDSLHNIEENIYAEDKFNGHRYERDEDKSNGHRYERESDLKRDMDPRRDRENDGPSPGKEFLAAHGRDDLISPGKDRLTSPGRDYLTGSSKDCQSSPGKDNLTSLNKDNLTGREDRPDRRYRQKKPSSATASTEVVRHQTAEDAETRTFPTDKRRRKFSLNLINKSNELSTVGGPKKRKFSLNLSFGSAALPLGFSTSVIGGGKKGGSSSGAEYGGDILYNIGIVSPSDNYVKSKQRFR